MTRSVDITPQSDDVAQAERRRIELANNGQLQRGKADAESAETTRVRGALTGALDSLKKATLNRDTTQAGRDHYNRKHTEAVRAGQNLATHLGTDVLLVPEFLPPPTPQSAPTMRISPARADGSYRETMGLGPSGKGVAPPGAVFGSAADTTWLETQRAAGIVK